MNCLVCSFGGVTSAELRTPGGMRWRRAYPGRRDQARSARRFVGFLLDTPPGLVCLCAGLALEYAGLCWLAHIADQVTGRRRR